MAEFQAGLHKDVTLIFQGIWDPTVDNTEQSYEPTVTNKVAYHMGSRSAHNHYREPKLASVAKALSDIPGHIFSLKSRRKKEIIVDIQTFDH